MLFMHASPSDGRTEADDGAELNVEWDGEGSGSGRRQPHGRRCLGAVLAVRARGPPQLRLVSFERCERDDRSKTRRSRRLRVATTAVPPARHEEIKGFPYRIFITVLQMTSRKLASNWGVRRGCTRGGLT